MKDQAHNLRVLKNRQNNKKTKIVTVTSGKGGVGKSSFVLNLAISLTRRGQRVLVIDTDFGFSNIDVMLGVHTEYDLMDVVNGDKSIEEIIETGHEGVKFISGGSGVYELTKLSRKQLLSIVDTLYGLEDVADTIIFDTSAGVSDNMLRLICASHETILVTTPEPTAIVDAYALVKIICEESIVPNLSLVVNNADSRNAAQTAMDGLTRIVKKNFDIEIKKLGYILRDINMHNAVTKQVPVLVSYPKSTASVNIEVLASKYLNTPSIKTIKLGLAGFFERFLAKRSEKAE